MKGPDGCRTRLAPAIKEMPLRPQIDRLMAEARVGKDQLTLVQL